MATPELPPLPERVRVYTIDGIKYVDGETFADWYAMQVERERILLDRIEELETDAARYRWLRNAISCRIVSHTTGELTSNYVEWYHLSAQFGAGSLDAAIDAAREAKP